MSLLQLTNVHKHYRGVHALQGVSFNLEPGTLVGLFGHNGAGKTTTIKLILGLLQADGGRLQVLGEDPAAKAFRQARQAIGFLQENVSFYDQLSGREVLHYFARLKGVALKEADGRLEELGLGQAAGRRVATYSKGMRQRLGLAQAMLGRPKLLLLDEPTVGLDPVATQAFYESVHRLREQGCAVILCSHVLPGVEPYLDRALILGKGRLLADGTLAELKAQADLPLVLSLSGNDLLAQLPQSLQRQAEATTDGLRLRGRLADKLVFNQLLGGLSGVRDFQWQLPDLVALYNHHCGELAK
ncbi:ABC transporter ATP-binding protein [Gallaecimonas sp. GXIMD4217]|uniref:ABC transporter ATP-binding protein n=1 Tax=Gallaecimonas sp. GXIMD4217 TaxID=3131927 RepID=UPI00311AECC8